MAVKNVLHMNSGDGETSYANNSSLQKVLMARSLHVLDETLKDMFNDHLGFPKCFKMVDLGCSSGPNTFLATSHIINIIEELCREKNINELPEFEVFLNDLPDNDFNNLFKLLLNENGEERKNCFIYGLPGSFYRRLLPKKSIDFAYSSCSIHWISQVPEGLTKKNKENVFLTVKSPPAVYEAYAKQYQRDFCEFLNLRAEEIIPGGRMVLTFVSRSVEDPSIIDDYATYTLLAKILLDMVAEGLVNKEDLYSFNVPIYTPHTKEVEAAIQTERSFSLEKMDVFRVRWDACDSTIVNEDEEDQQIFYKHKSGKIVADCFRAFMEPMLVSHFGSSIMDDLFRRYEKEAAGHLTTHKSTCINIVISLKRR